MKRAIRHFIAAVGLAPLLAGCAIYDEALLPTLTGEFGGGVKAASRPAAPSDPPAVGQAVAAAPLQPLAIIRFAEPDRPFEDDLQAAIRQALARKPDAGFGLVAVSPAAEGATLDAAAVQRNIERVLAAMTKAGVAEERVIFSATSDRRAVSNEVRIYVLNLSKTP